MKRQGAALVRVISQRDGAALALPCVICSSLQQHVSDGRVCLQARFIHLHCAVFAVLGRPLRCWRCRHVAGLLRHCFRGKGGGVGVHHV